MTSTSGSASSPRAADRPGPDGVPTIGVAIAIPEPWATELQDYRLRIGDPTASGVPSHITLIPPIDVDGTSPRSRRTSSRPPQRHDRLPGTSARNGYLPARVTGRLHHVSPRGSPSASSSPTTYGDGPLDLDLDFPYHPHVTVAHHLGDDELDRAFDDLGDFECSFDVADFHLYVHEGELGWQSSRSFPLNRDS